MKKLIGLFVAAMMLFSVMTANAKVTYEEKDGKWVNIADINDPDTTTYLYKN